MMTPLLLAVSLFLAPTPKAAAPDSPAAKAKAVLDEPANVVIENKSMADFVAFVKAKTRLEVMLDQSVMGQLAVEGNMVQLSANARDVPLREGLDSALAPLGLKIGAVGGVLVISTEDGLVTKQMRQKVSVSTGEAAEVFAKLKAKTGANIVIDPREKENFAKAKCELDLTDVTLETAVRLAAEVSGFRTVRMGNVLFVTSNARAKELRADCDGPTQPGGSFPMFSRGDDLPVLPPGLGGVAPVPAINPPVAPPPASR